MSMGEPGLWAPNDLDTILGSYGAFIVERSGTDIDQALGSLGQYEHNIWVISQVIQNDISSTKVRLFLKKDLSVRYLIPDPVVEVCSTPNVKCRALTHTWQYIDEHHLFSEGNPNKSREQTPSATPGPSEQKPDQKPVKG